MKLSNRFVSLVKDLAAQKWTWDRKSVELTLTALGWSKSESHGHRDAYKSTDGIRASVYHDGDRPELIEFVAEAFVDVESLSDVQYEDKVDEFYAGFVQGTQQISDFLGMPTFSNGAAANGFPEDQEAVWLSLWSVPSGRLMLQEKHEDRELPFRLCVAVAPPIGRNGE